MKAGPCTAAAEEGVSKQKLTHASVTVPHKGHAEAKDKCKGLVPPMHSPHTHTRGAELCPGRHGHVPIGKAHSSATRAMMAQSE